MREYKFRGLDIMGNWHYGLIANPNIDIAGGAKKDHWYISNKGGLPFAYEVRQETIGKYTGLNDKKRVYAFFDDVVTLDGNPCKWWVTQDDFGIPVFVNLTKEHTTFDQIDFKDYFMSQGKHSFEIITNIHESPDLQGDSK